MEGCANHHIFQSEIQIYPHFPIRVVVRGSVCLQKQSHPPMRAENKRKDGSQAVRHDCAQ